MEFTVLAKDLEGNELKFNFEFQNGDAWYSIDHKKVKAEGYDGFGAPELEIDAHGDVYGILTLGSKKVDGLLYEEENTIPDNCMIEEGVYNLK